MGLEEGRLACAFRVIRGEEVAEHFPLLDDGDLNPGQRHSGTVSERLDPREFNPAGDPTAGLPLGTVVATATALRHIDPPDVLSALQQHQSRDGGLVGAEDLGANDRALIEGTRLLPAYDSATRVRFRIITEWDRTLTTVPRPADY